MKTVAVVQARMGSTRLPGKVMKAINGKPMISLLLARLSKAKRLDGIIVATTTDPKDDIFVNYIESLGFACHRGSENDVLARVLEAALKLNADTVVRITGDCPLIDHEIVDEVIEKFVDTKSDYCSNAENRTYPDGLDTEVFSIEALQRSSSLTQDKFDREHVTPFLRKSPLFRRSSVESNVDYSKLRWTVDEQNDLTVIQNVFSQFLPDIYFGWRAVIEFQGKRPDIFVANAKSQNNEGSHMTQGQKLWRRAKQIIPGGNMLLSKRSEMFLPDLWPAYFSKAKGCQVWDLDDNQYTDMSIMGIGTNILGYGHPEVDAAVHKTVDAGNMSTLNCPEEVYLVEKLLELHPWADMGRLARSGGEANAVAIRIARAASGRDKVAVCGYHGWHDWYLSTNLGDKQNLAGHLLPGLDPRGVPQNLQGTALPFNYNDFEMLEELVNSHDIGVIKMEVARNKGPENNFLQKVRKLATDHGIVLVFDECTSGFRQTLGGLHKLYGVEPDMAMFGKALGNGYAITATIGRREIMEAAQSTFISSTFWTERIGPTAALKTLEVMERLQSWDTITNTGLQIRQRWQRLADKNGLQIEYWGLPALTGYSFNSANALAYKTLITQEMLGKGFLASNCVYVSTAHTDEVLDSYFAALDPLFALVRECEDGRDVMKLLKGPICHAGFKRLN